VLLLAFGGVVASVYVGAVTLSALRLLPRWLAVLGLIAAAVLPLSLFSIPFVVLPVWVAATGLALRSAFASA
jgi:hypothetical protein